MYCPRCGTWTPEGEAACVQCGASLAVAPAPGIAPSAAAILEPLPIAGEAAANLPAYGGFWRRLAAWIVDGTILFFPDAVLRVFLGLPTLLTLRPVLESDMPRLMLVYALGTLTWWLYAALLESSPAQGTLGQQLLGLRVTTVPGERVSFGRASARYFGQWLSALLCGLGYLFNLWSSRRQTLHDMVSGCVLVRAQRADHAAESPGRLAGGHAS